MTTHTGEYKYNCNYCENHFLEENELNRHMKEHTIEKTFNPNKDTKTHSDENPYQCRLCDKGFIIERDLEIHMKIHCGENPFKCFHYNKAFNMKVD